MPDLSFLPWERQFVFEVASHTIPVIGERFSGHHTRQRIKPGERIVWCPGTRRESGIDGVLAAIVGAIAWDQIVIVGSVNLKRQAPLAECRETTDRMRLALGFG